ncbi:mCG1035439, partial [Mus musculus]
NEDNLKFLKFACKTLQSLIYEGGHSYELLLYTTQYTILHEGNSSSAEVNKNQVLIYCSSFYLAGERKK